MISTVTKTFSKEDFNDLLDVLKLASNLSGICTPYKTTAYNLYNKLQEKPNYSETTIYLRDWQLHKEDIEIRRQIEQYVGENKFDDIYVSTAEEVLHDIHRSHGNIVKSYPALAEKRLKELPPETKVKCYERSSDGWGCIYVNINIVEIL